MSRKDAAYLSLDGNRRGEANERLIYTLLQAEASKSNDLFIMQGLDIPFVKLYLLKQQYPAVTAQVDAFINSDNRLQPCTCTNGCGCKLGESDFIVLVRGKGAVVLEVKSTAKETKKAIEKIKKFIGLSITLKKFSLFFFLKNRFNFFFNIFLNIFFAKKIKKKEAKNAKKFSKLISISLIPPA